MDIIRLYFKIANFVGYFLCNGTAKMKLAILAFLYCGEFEKNLIALKDS